MQLRDVLCRGDVRAMSVILLAIAAFIQVRAQTIPVDREALESGAGAGMAAYADPDGYPGPKHLLEMQDTLRLTDDQLKNIESVFDEMSESARSLGSRIIQLEEQLHDLFTTGTAEEPDVRRRSTEIGRLRGELRSVHLAAHIQATRVLNRRQIELYTQLRKAGGKAQQATSSHRPGSR